MAEPEATQARLVRSAGRRDGRSFPARRPPKRLSVPAVQDPGYALPMRRPLRLGCLLLAACAAPAPASSGTAGTKAPTPYRPHDADEDAATPLEVQDLEVGLAALIEHFATLDLFWYHELWDDRFWSNIDEACPALQVHNGMDYWDDRCTARSGTEFRGWTIGFREGGFEEFPGTTLVHFDWLSGHAVLLLADGTVLENFGDVEYQRRRYETAAGFREVWEGFVWGDFSYTGDEAAGTWLQSGVSTEAYYRYEEGPAGDRRLELDAEVGFLPGPVLAARIEGMRIADDPRGCALEPAGQVRLRGQDGTWITVVWDADSTGDAACDGCGWATGPDGEMGAVCADFAPLLAWTGSDPWVH